MIRFFRKQRVKQIKCKKGFTLIELIIVISILAILGTVVGVVMGNQVTNAKKAVADSNATTYYADIQSAWAWSVSGSSLCFDVSTKKASQVLADFIEEEMDTASEGVIYVWMDQSTSLGGVSGVAFAPKGTNYIGVHGTCSCGEEELKADTPAVKANDIVKTATFAITIDSSSNFTYTEKIPELGMK